MTPHNFVTNERAELDEIILRDLNLRLILNFSGGDAYSCLQRLIQNIASAEESALDWKKIRIPCNYFVDIKMMNSKIHIKHKCESESELISDINTVNENYKSCTPHIICTLGGNDKHWKEKKFKNPF